MHAIINIEKTLMYSFVHHAIVSGTSFIALQSVLKFFLSFCLELHNHQPKLCHNKARGSKSKAVFLIPPIDEEKNGGDPMHLSHEGPKGATLTFHVFAPPTFDKEIPKVDMYGAINFVRTGNVRTFVPIGSRRLLVINLQKMTVEVYAPKPNFQHQKETKQQNSSTELRLLLFSERCLSGNIGGGEGINISTTRKVDDSVGVKICRSDTARWNTGNFDTNPTVRYILHDLESVAAVPPRHGGVVEVISRLRACPTGICLHSSEWGGKYQDNKLHTGDNHDAVPRRDEYIFITPREAAEFQRTFVLLCMAGREISHLYETLEAVGLAAAHKTQTAFASCGVELDDAWECFKEIPILREGLHQFYLWKKSNSTSTKMKLAAPSSSMFLGLVDFISLFSPPLPTKLSLSAPYSALCAKLDPDLQFSTKGIECHYQHMHFVSSLKRLVRRAALYVRLFTWTRNILQDKLLQDFKHYRSPISEFVNKRSSRGGPHKNGYQGYVSMNHAPRNFLKLVYFIL